MSLGSSIVRTVTETPTTTHSLLVGLVETLNLNQLPRAGRSRLGETQHAIGLVRRAGSWLTAEFRVQRWLKGH